MSLIMNDSASVLWTQFIIYFVAPVIRMDNVSLSEAE